MNLYDNDAYRDAFMEGVYDILEDDPTNDRANAIIELFDSAPSVQQTGSKPLTCEGCYYKTHGSFGMCMCCVREKEDKYCNEPKGRRTAHEHRPN